jgi:hypothetical protein
MEGDKVVVFDKDDTVLTNGEPFPGVEDFLTRMRAQNRICAIATTRRGDALEEEFPAELRPYFNGGLYGRAKILGEGIYIRTDGRPGKIKDDLHPDPALEGQRQAIRKRLERLGHWQGIKNWQKAFNKNSQLNLSLHNKLSALSPQVHKETNEVLNPKSKYVNPNLGPDRYAIKDLLLLRRYIAGHDYEKLKMVMIGNGGDIGVESSDPNTPLIVVGIDGKWIHRPNAEILLDTLLDTPHSPAQVYDTLFQQGRSVTIPCQIRGTQNTAVEIGGREFLFEIREGNGRIIWENYGDF